MPRSLLLLILGAQACAANVAQQRQIALPATSALGEGRFEDAQRAADTALGADPSNPQALLVRAFVRYKQQIHQLVQDVQTAALTLALSRGLFNHRYIHQSFEEASATFAAIDADLAKAAASPWVDLELCLACWRVDWNHDQRINSRDERLFEVERDADGHDLPDGDPRRRPVFHFDVGDVYWARAMLAFQRAVLEVLLAYRWDEIDALVARAKSGDGPVVIHIGDKTRIGKAKALVLDGLDHADRSRREYLDETDDDREWLPNPKQKSHPLPLPVDEQLYRTWAEVIQDVRLLVRGERGLDVAEIAQLGDHQWEQPPKGFIHIGMLFSDPRDLSIDPNVMRQARNDPTATLRSVFGAAYVADMPRSELVTRLLRMKGEIKRGEESFERKLRYLLWLN